MTKLLIQIIHAKNILSNEDSTKEIFYKPIQIILLKQYQQNSLQE